MHIVCDLLKTKGNRVWTINPQASVYEALELMATKNIGAIVVTDHDLVVGIFSERDYARKVILLGRTSKTTLVSELMTRDVLYISRDDTIDNCMALMTTKRLRHLPVLENGKLVGLVSIGDVVKAIISGQEITIRELERYITGGHTTQG